MTRHLFRNERRRFSPHPAAHVGCFLVLLTGVSIAQARQDPSSAGAFPLRIATFAVDVTPPLGSPLCDGLVEPAQQIVDPLSARGVILLTDQSPIVLCAVDWVGIGNTGHDRWRSALAEAVGTSIDRVAVHTLHQHDAPGCDFAADALLREHGLPGALFDGAFAEQAIERVAAAARAAQGQPRTVTHIGLGTAPVRRVASNRRILGADGKVRIVRFSSATDPEAIAAPEGVIDPRLRLISFWDQGQVVVAMSHYATHPQSYYGRGGVSADFVGMARNQFEAQMPGGMLVHFNGAGGNVAAGKYNTGAPEIRPQLAERLQAGMREAWERTRQIPITADDIDWKTVPVQLPPRKTLVEQELRSIVADTQLPVRRRCRAARDLIYLQRCQAGKPITLARLRLKTAQVLYMPGELFVEYQLAAQAMQPDEFIAMAAYGDYGPGYIGTEIAYSQGGYETGPVSRTAPSVERVLMPAMRRLLQR